MKLKNSIPNVEERNGLIGAVNLHGEVIIPFIYVDMYNFLDGITCAQNLKGYWGIINDKNEEVISFKYDELISGKNKIFPAKYEGKWGLITIEEKLICPFEYDELSSFHKESFSVKKNNKWGIINFNGKLITPFLYDNLESFYPDDIGIFEISDKNGLINSKGEIILEPIPESITMFYNGISSVWDEEFQKCAILNAEGEFITDFEFEDSGICTEGLIAVKKEGKWGYICTKGNIKIPYQFEKASTFKRGKADIIYAGKKGYIEENGTIRFYAESKNYDTKKISTYLFLFFLICWIITCS